MKLKTDLEMKRKLNAQMRIQKEQAEQADFLDRHFLQVSASWRFVD